MTDQARNMHDGIAVSLVDGDPVIRRARQIMLLSEHYDVRSYATCAALLADPRSRDVPCIIVDGTDDSAISALDTMRAAGWRGKAILLDGGIPRADLLQSAERHGDRILDRTTGDATLIAAIAASIDHGWYGWHADVLGR